MGRGREGGGWQESVAPRRDRRLVARCSADRKAQVPSPERGAQGRKARSGEVHPLSLPAVPVPAKSPGPGRP